MSNVLVLPYKLGSESAKTLAKSMSFKRMRLENSSVSDSSDKTIINWGNSTVNLSHLPSVKVLNKPASVRKASHKGEFFQAISEYNVANPEAPVSIPDWTTKKSEACEWYRDGHDVVCRAVLQGHSGEGLTISNFKEDVTATKAIPSSLLYTKYVKKRDEFRVHVMNGVPFFVQKKAIPYHNRAEINYQVRNHSNGFVFTIDGVAPDASVVSEAVKAVEVLGLDFGSVDVIWNKRRKKATVIEVNTACSISGESTKDRYVSAFRATLAGDKPLMWDVTLVNNSNRNNFIGPVGYTEINVDSCHEDGTLLSLSAEVIDELLRRHLETPDHTCPTLRYIMEDITVSRRYLRIFSIEGFHPDMESDWVKISTWRDGEEMRLPFWVHPSQLIRYAP